MRGKAPEGFSAACFIFTPLSLFISQPSAPCSSPNPNTTWSIYDSMAADVQKRVFFAGEATNGDYFGTVHAAILSGRREARKVIRQAQKA